MTVEDNNWSSVADVLHSFNNVSIMPNSSRRNNDIFANPSPPKHRISPSQLELLEGGLDGYSGRENEPSYPSSRGRGRVIKEIMEKISPHGIYRAMENDIRSVCTDQSNAVIEYLHKNKSYSGREPEIEVDSTKESEGSSDIYSADADQISINSSLNADAEPFYPTDNKENTLLLPNLDPVIRFTNHDMCETASEDEKDHELPSNSNLTSSSQHNITPVEEQKSSVDIPEEVKVVVKQRKQKRIMKNALLSSLPIKQSESKQPNPLMRPSDFTCSVSSQVLSNNSTFHPVQGTSQTEKLTENSSNCLGTPYDFMSDPTIDPKTRDVIKSLTSEPSSSVSSSHITPPSLSSSSHNQLRFSSSPKKGALSYYGYNYNENDFPPL